MGSGVAWRLRRCGFDVIIAESSQPMAVRRWVAFSEAIYEGAHTIESIASWRVEALQLDLINDLCRKGEIPVLVCPGPEDIPALNPDVVIDAILAKRNTGTARGMARLVIGLGPGFTAGADVDCVIETNRGANLGRCIWDGAAEANTGIPGAQAGETVKRVLRAPVTGALEPLCSIGDLVKTGDPAARVAGVKVHSQLDGIVRGMLRQGTSVDQGVKIGDIDPRGDRKICRHISDKALAIAGGVLEAVLTP
jgi:xanthine dehydrogenase accessory factor